MAGAAPVAAPGGHPDAAAAALPGLGVAAEALLSSVGAAAAAASGFAARWGLVRVGGGDGVREAAC
jgi:hypothetical protein